MRFSVIIPVRKNGKIEHVIKSLQKSTYPQDKIEIIVTYGDQPSAQRNKAVTHATGEMLYFFDDDSEITPDLFNIISKHLSDSNIAGAGGPNLTPPDNTFIQHCFGMALASKFANGKVSARYHKTGLVRESNETELILCNLCIKREVYLKIGGLNESIYPNEENEFMNRLKKNGYKLIYDPEAFIFRSRRKNFTQLIKQHLNYGRGRIEQTLVEGIHPHTIQFFIPLGFLFYLLTLPFLCNLSYYLPLIIYLFLSFISAAGWAVETKKPVVFFIMPIIYLVMHISYASGIIWGFIRQKIKHVKPVISDIEIVKLKEFCI